MFMGFDEINAPAAWRCVDFISDLHLQESEPGTFLAWRKYLEQSSADAIFILGDLFEVWVGDDVLGHVGQANLTARHEGLHFEDRCCRVLHYCAERRHVYFMHGNRDFLVGKRFLDASGVQLINDPSVLNFGGQRYLLSHGDALCLADTDYMAFRAQVRNAAWQEQFLDTPLQERLQQARVMRMQSEAHKRSQQVAGVPWADVDLPAAVQWLDAAQCQHMIHGHTHEGRDHPIRSAQGAGVRHVLPDWHVTPPARGYALRLSLSPEGVNTEQASVF
jgi:UDP-2,3-diacylglucosamine hydrolase